MYIGTKSVKTMVGGRVYIGVYDWLYLLCKFNYSTEFNVTVVQIINMRYP